MLQTNVSLTFENSDTEKIVQRRSKDSLPLICDLAETGVRGPELSVNFCAQSVDETIRFGSEQFCKMNVTS